MIHHEGDGPMRLELERRGPGLRSRAVRTMMRSAVGTVIMGSLEKLRGAVAAPLAAPVPVRVATRRLRAPRRLR